MKRKAKIDEIKVWYRFKPEISMWFSKMKGKSHIHKLPDETWYDGYWFNSGYFCFVQFKYFAFHVILKWWQINLKTENYEMVKKINRNTGINKCANSNKFIFE